MTSPVLAELWTFGALRLIPLAAAAILWLLGGFTGVEALALAAALAPATLLALGVRAAHTRTARVALPLRLPLAAVHGFLVAGTAAALAAFAWRFVLTSLHAALAAVLVLELAAAFMLGLHLAVPLTHPLAPRSRSREALLADLLADLFTPDELRRFIAQDIDPALAHDFPTKAGTQRDLCESVVALLARTGLLGDPVFQRLAAARPHQRARIIARAADWTAPETLP